MSLAVLLALLILAFPGAAAPLVQAAAEEPVPAVGAAVPMTREELLRHLDAPQPAPASEPASAPFPRLPLLGLVQTDCGQLGDAPATREDAREVDAPVACDGTLAWDDVKDAYRIRADHGDLITANVTSNAPSQVEVCLFAPSGEKTLCGREFNRLRWTAHETGDWTAIVSVDRNRFFESKGYQLALAVVAPPTPDDCATGTDAGDGLAGAIRLHVSDVCAGYVNARLDPTDAYALALAAGEAVSVSMAPEDGLYTHACLHVADGMVLVDCVWGKGQAYLMAPSSGDHLLTVRSHHPSVTGSYVLHVDPAPPQDDCGAGIDAASFHPAAVPTPPVECGALLAEALGDDLDVFRFQGPEAVRLVLESQGTGEFGACLFAPEQEGACVRSRAGESFTLPLMAVAAGEWELWVVAWPFDVKADVSYAFRLESFTPAPQDDCGSGRDAASGNWTAPLPESGACGGILRLSDGDWHDGYTFEIPQAGTVTANVTLASPDATAWVCLYAGSWQCDESRGSVSLTVQASAGVTGQLHVSPGWQPEESSYEVRVARPG